MWELKLEGDGDLEVVGDEVVDEVDRWDAEVVGEVEVGDDTQE
jgi:hypothetical protein